MVKPRKILSLCEVAEVEGYNQGKLSDISHIFTNRSPPSKTTGTGKQKLFAPHYDFGYHVAQYDTKDYIVSQQAKVADAGEPILSQEQL